MNQTLLLPSVCGFSLANHILYLIPDPIPKGPYIKVLYKKLLLKSLIFCQAIAMNMNVTVRRNIDNDDFLDVQSMIHEEFLICALFSRTISAVNESISMPLRVTILCELLEAGNIELRNGKVFSRQAILDDKVLQEVHKKVALRPLPVNKLLTALNGESFNVRNFPIHMKNLRAKVIKRLVEKNLISKKDRNASLLENAVRKVYTQFNVGNFIVAQEVRETYVNRVWSYLLSERIVPRMDALVCCLNYSNSLDDILIGMTPVDNQKAKEKLGKIHKMCTSSTILDSTVYYILLCMIKL